MLTYLFGSSSLSLSLSLSLILLEVLDQVLVAITAVHRAARSLSARAGKGRAGEGEGEREGKGSKGREGEGTGEREGQPAASVPGQESTMKLPVDLDDKGTSIFGPLVPLSEGAVLIITLLGETLVHLVMCCPNE